MLSLPAGAMSSAGCHAFRAAEACGSKGLPGTMPSAQRKHADRKDCRVPCLPRVGMNLVPKAQNALPAQPFKGVTTVLEQFPQAKREG